MLWANILLSCRCLASCGATQVADTVAEAVVLLSSEITNNQEEHGICTAVIRNGSTSRGRPNFEIVFIPRINNHLNK